MSRLTHACLLSLAILLGAVQGATAGVPNTLNYQGILTDGAGQPVTGDKTIKLSLYTAPTGGTAFWTETQTLALVDGRLAVVLGAKPANPLDPKKFTGETYIGIRVGTDAEMPRQKFSSVAYAFQAGDGGVPKGGIIMWSGAVDAVPEGWALCNGDSGTPDLRDKFIVGAGSTYPAGSTGGSAMVNIGHTHTIPGDAPGTSWNGDHTHPFSGTTDANTWRPNRTDSGSTQVTGDHRHTFSGTTDTAGGHSHNVAAHSHGGATGVGGTGNLDVRPPYYALAYIMKL